MTRSEHVEWAKSRAREYLDQGDVVNAFASMASDMPKHPGCDIPAVLTQLGMMAVMNRDAGDMRRWIDGFN